VPDSVFYLSFARYTCGVDKGTEWESLLPKLHHFVHCREGEQDDRVNGAGSSSGRIPAAGGRDGGIAESACDGDDSTATHLWDFEVTASGEENAGSLASAAGKSQSTCGEEADAKRIVKGGDGEKCDDVVGVLGCSSERNLLLNEVFELSAFLRQRMRESASSDDKAKVTRRQAGGSVGRVMPCLPDHLVVQPSTMKTWFEACNSVIDMLSKRETMNLLLFCKGGKSLEREITRLKMLKTVSLKPELAQKQLVRRLEHLSQEIASARAEYEAVRRLTKEEQVGFERAVSQLVSSECKIVGGIQ